MVVIKKFNLFNESIRDYMKPKSEEEIDFALSKLSPTRKISKLMAHGMLDRLTDEEKKDYVLTRKTANEKISYIKKFGIDRLFSDEELINLLRQHTANHDEMRYGIEHNRIEIVRDAIKRDKSWKIGYRFFKEYDLYSTDEVQYAALSGYKGIVELLINHGYVTYHLLPYKIEGPVYSELVDVLGKIGYGDIRDLLLKKNVIIRKYPQTSFTNRIYSLSK